MADVYVCVNGPQGTGDGSSWANCTDLATAWGLVASGVRVHVRHHSLHHDGTPSGLAAYSLSTVLTMSTGATATNPYAIIGYGPDDQPSTRYEDNPVLDFAGLASGNPACQHQNYGVFYGLTVKNTPGSAFTYARTAAWVFCDFESLGGDAVNSGGTYCRAIGCRVRWSTGGFTFTGSNGVALFNEIVECSTTEGVQLTGASGVAAGNIVSNDGNAAYMDIRDYGVAAFNTLRGTGSLTAVLTGSTTWGLAAANVVEGIGTGGQANNGLTALSASLRNLIHATNPYNTLPVLVVGDVLADPGWIDPVLPDLTHPAATTPLSDVSDHRLGGWYGGGGGGGGGGGWRPRALRHGF